MTQVNQIIPGAAVAKNGPAKTASAKTGADGSSEARFALDLPPEEGTAAPDQAAIVNSGEAAANQTVEKTAQGKTALVNTEPLPDGTAETAKTGKRVEDADTAQTPQPTESVETQPEPPKADAAPIVEVSVPAAPPAPVVDAAPKPESSEGETEAETTAKAETTSPAVEKPAAAQGNDAAPQPRKNGLLANRAGNGVKAGQSEANGNQNADVAPVNTDGEVEGGSETVKAPKAATVAAAPSAVQSGQAQGLDVATQATARAVAGKAASDGETSGDAKPAFDVKNANSKSAAPEHSDAVPRAENPNARSPLLKTLASSANNDFTFRLADRSEGQTGSQTTGEQAASLTNASRAVQTVSVQPTAAAGARVSSLPVHNMAVEIAQRYQAGSNRFRIKLDPPELGRIDVRMDVSKDGRVSAHLTAEKPETLAALSRDAGALERALNANGLETDKNSLNFSLRQGNQGFGGTGEEGDFSPAGTGDNALAADDEAALPETVIRGYASPTGVDLHV